MIMNKADQILMNEISKIDRKIKGHKSEIIKLEVTRKQIMESITNKQLHYDNE